MRARARHLRRRGAATRAGLALSLVGLSGSGVLALPSAGLAADTCTVPALSDVLVSQGPAQTTGLAAGKTTLVKLYLSTASCLPVGASVQVTAGKLVVGNNATELPLLAALPLPPLAPSSTAPVNANRSDVTFLVPGTKMTPSVGTKVTFSAVLDYTVRLNGQATPGRVAFAYSPDGTPSLSADVVPSLNEVDVLVVPLATGNASTIASQYTDATRTVTEQGFGTMRRLFPTSDTGLRYTTSAGVKIPGTTTPLCVNGVTWGVTMAPLVEAQRVAWNSVATNQHMDRALGVVDQAVSSGPSSTTDPKGSPCADGFGQLSGSAKSTLPVKLTTAGPGTDAFARAVTTTSAWGGATVGSLFSMEVAHTTGAVSSLYKPNVTSGPGGGTRAIGAHSAWKSGDPLQTERAYDLDKQVPLPDSVARSVMQFSGPGWNDRTTVFEKQDWDYVLCSLLPTPPGVPISSNPTLASLAPELTSCDNPGGLGYAAAAVDGSYAVMGTTDGTAQGTSAQTTDSASTVIDPSVPNSPLRVVQYDANGQVIANDGIAVHLNNTEHNDRPQTYADVRGVFGGQVPAKSGTRRLALFVGNPSPTNQPIYSREVTSRPSFQSVNVSGAEVTATINHPLPQNLRLDLFGSCGSNTAPLLTNTAPTATTPGVAGLPGTASFLATFDASALCANPTFTTRVTDGIQSTTSAASTGTGGAVSPTAEITAPTPGDVATTFSSIALAGRVADNLGREASRLEWTATSVDTSGVSTTRTVATGRLGLAVPPAAGWPTGTTTVSLKGYDGAGALVASQSRVVAIALDSDGDGLADAYEQGLTCLGVGAATDPFTANLDSDADGYANIDDSQPCLSANTVAVAFNPTSLYKGSNGQGVTVNLSNPQGVDLTTLHASDIVVRQVGGATVARLTGSPTALTAVSFAASSPTNAQVKFDRSALIAVLGDRLGYLPLFIGTVDDSLRGADARAPYVFP